MTKFGGDGKYKKACKGHKCEKIKTEEEDMWIQILPPPNTKSKEKKETKKNQKKAGNLTASIKVETPNKANANQAKQIAEIKTEAKEQNSTRKDRSPPRDTSAESEKRLNPINQIRHYYMTEGKKKAADQAAATKNRNPWGI